MSCFNQYKARGCLYTECISTCYILWHFGVPHPPPPGPADLCTLYPALYKSPYLYPQTSPNQFTLQHPPPPPPPRLLFPQHDFSGWLGTALGLFSCFAPHDLFPGWLSNVAFRARAGPAPPRLKSMPPATSPAALDNCRLLFSREFPANSCRIGRCWSLTVGLGWWSGTVYHVWNGRVGQMDPINGKEKL